MSDVLKVKTARMGKYFGKELEAGADVTSDFNPLNPTHKNMLSTGALILVKEETPKTRTRRSSSKGSK